MADNTLKLVRDVKKGDVLTGGGIVTCVVRTLCISGRSQMVVISGNNQQGGVRNPLIITPWHPIKIEGNWSFPADHYITKSVLCDAVFSFLVMKAKGTKEMSETDGKYDTSVIISGIECLALAHGITNDAVASHPFFGTESVVKSLEKCPGWKEGLVVLSNNSVASSMEAFDSTNIGRNNQLNTEVVNNETNEKIRSVQMVRDEKTGLVCGFSI